MNKVTQLTVMVFILLSISISAMAQKNILSEIENSLDEQYTTLEQLMEDNTEASILGNQYSSRQSVADAINKLFANKKLKDYRLLHSGENNNSTFMVITVTADEIKYRMNLLLKNNKISEIRIEQEQ